MYTLDKQVFNKLDTGWLAPNGDWYPCDYMEHLMLADDLWHSMRQEWVPDVEQKLLEMGWVEVQLMRFDRPYYLFHWDYEHGHLTPEQVRVIKPIVEDNWEMILKSNRFELKEVKNTGMKGKETEIHHSGRVFRIREVAQ